MKRSVLVTGSSRGIGRATATEFASRGYNVALNYVKSDESAARLKEELERNYGVRVVALKADLSKSEDAERLGKEALAAFGCIDVLVNNAAVAPYGPVGEKSVQDWISTLQTDLVAPFILSRMLGEEMMKNKYGKIVNIASIDAMKTYNPESMEYDASKAAIINLTKNLALQFQPYVNVNCVAPGWVATDMNKELPEEIVSFQSSRICKGRFAKPEEIAHLICFLSSDDAEFIDGELIRIDGGYKFM